MKCSKCGNEFDPRVQAAFCGKRVRHYPVTRVSEWEPPKQLAPTPPKRRTPFQSDFMLLWDERPLPSPTGARRRGIRHERHKDHDNGYA